MDTDNDPRLNDLLDWLVYAAKRADDGTVRATRDIKAGEEVYIDIP